MTDSKKNDEPVPTDADGGEVRKYKRGRPRSRKIKDDTTSEKPAVAAQQAIEMHRCVDFADAVLGKHGDADGSRAEPL